MSFILTPPPYVLDQILENVVEFYIVYCDDIDNHCYPYI